MLSVTLDINGRPGAFDLTFLILLFSQIGHTELTVLSSLRSNYLATPNTEDMTSDTEPSIHTIGSKTAVAVSYHETDFTEVYHLWMMNDAKLIILGKDHVGTGATEKKGKQGCIKKMSKYISELEQLLGLR